jgi:multiple sugar transport system permease protein
MSTTVRNIPQNGVRLSFSERLSRLANNEALIGVLFILPSLIGFIFFFAIPAIRSVFISFTDWNLVGPANYVALKQYDTLFHDIHFWQSLLITLQYVVWNIPLQTIIATFIALMMNRIQNSAFLRGVMVIPWLLPNVVVGLLWLWILDPTLGILNTGLSLLGLPRQPFLGSPDQAIISVAMINIWRHAGYTSILIFAGLKTIPKTLYEAAAIDGANGVVQFFRITLPLLRPVLAFVLITSIIGSFQVFDTVAITTPNGGPAGSTSVIIYYIYNQVFNRGFKMGIATAASVFLFAILIVVTLIQTRLLNANRSDLSDYS